MQSEYYSNMVTAGLVGLPRDLFWLLLNQLAPKDVLALQRGRIFS